MTVNITLLIQVIHFFIALWIMRRYFWRPVNTIIERDQAEYDRVSKRIGKQQDICQIKEDELRSIWQRARKRFAQSIPTFAASTVALRRNDSVEKVPASAVDDQALVDSLAGTIVKQVTDGA